jgi:hypothetical protein
MGRVPPVDRRPSPRCALGLILVVEPGAAPAILVVGVVASLSLYGLMYAVERRRHW